MTPAQQQRKALAKRAKRYTRRQPNYEGINGGEIKDAIAAAYITGFRAGNVATVRAPAAALLHVLDTQTELEATIARLREKMRGISADLLWEAAK